MLTRFLLIFCFFAFSNSVDLRAQDYESHFQAALQEEAAQNWSAAIQNYMEALKHDPTKEFPEQRIKAILQERLKEGKSINSLRLLLTPEMDAEFERQGIYDLGRNEGGEADFGIGYLIYGLAFFLTFAVGFFIFRQIKKLRVKDEAYEMEQSPVQKKSQKTKSVPTQHRPAKASVLTEKTREELQGMLSSTQSLTGEMRRPEDIENLSDEEMANLQDSGVVKALAETLLSDVNIEETEAGKYSKLTLDASLFFDESDVDFFEKEFGHNSKA